MSQLKDSLAERGNSPLLRLSPLFRPSTDWMRPSHTGEDNLL